RSLLFASCLLLIIITLQQTLYSSLFPYTTLFRSIVEEPGSADLTALLEAVEGDGRGVEGLRGRDARGPCSDDADLRQGGIRIDGSGDCRCATALSNYVSHATQYCIENLNFHYNEVVDSVPPLNPTPHRWHGTLRAERDSARRTRLLEAAL